MRKLSSRVKRLEITLNKTTEVEEEEEKTAQDRWCVKVFDCCNTSTKSTTHMARDSTVRQACRNNITVPWIVNSIESVRDDKIETA